MGVRVQRVLLSLCAVALLASSASGATKEVSVRDSAFDPKVITASVGDTVSWSNPGTQKAHNVRERRSIFSSGRETTVFDFDVVFSAGTFLYRCAIHGSFTRSGAPRGMTGVVKVPVLVAGAPAGPASTVTWATTATNSGSAYDVQYRVGGGEWKFWLKATSVKKAVFGQSGKPIAPQAGTKYSFRARSRKGSAASEWSPVASINS